MNYTELVSVTAKRAGVSQETAKKVLDTLPVTLGAQLNLGDEVVVHGLGKFKSKDRPAREGRNPATGEAVQIAAARVASFSASSTFKKAVAA